jgi:hypothetical protein
MLTPFLVCLAVVESTAPVAVPPADVAAPDAVATVQVRAPPRGKVEGPIAPELVLGQDVIQSYGAGNLGQLLEALEPQLQSSRGRENGPPVVLLNGRRVSGQQDISGIPSEAIEKIEILPEEVALSYGYRADQRVTNFVLKKSYRALTSELGSRVATAGGRQTRTATANYFKILGGSRASLDLTVKDEDALFEDERRIVRTPDSSPFDRAGNLTSTTRGREIDPALSALAGSTVVAAVVPGRFAGAVPTLADFVPGAGRVAGDDLDDNRSLQPSNRQAVIRGTVSRDLNRNTAGTLTVSLDDSRSRSFLGLPGVALTLRAGSPYSPFTRNTTLYRYIDAPESLVRDVETLKSEARLGLDGRLGEWRWTANGSYERTESFTRTGRGLDTTAYRAAVSVSDPAVNPFGDAPAALLTRVPVDTARSVADKAAVEAVLRGTLLDLAAGPLSTTFKATAEQRDLASESVRSGILTERDLGSQRGEAQANFTLPISSRRREVLAPLGDLSVNLNLGYEALSDIGGLVTYGFALNWVPLKPLSFNASLTDEQGAPTIQQLNDPVVSTPNVSVFDFATNSSVSVTRIEGGNAGLLRDSRRVLKVAGNLKPFEKTNLTFNANYTRNRIDDSIAAFPSITRELEAAMPERFTRNAAGRLVAVDARPVNFTAVERDEVRWGVNYYGALRSGGGPSPGPKTAEKAGGQGNVQLSLYHTWRLQDRIILREGGPVLDLLDGAPGVRRGGQPRHEVQVQGSYFRNGLGLFLNSNWRAATRVQGTVAAQDLFFSDLGVLNLGAFADVAARPDWSKRYPWARGTRLSVNVDNLFDEKQSVHDGLGVTPQAFQSDYLDPVGRTLRITLRKVLS